ncbi:hypothetical protein XELAEV_180024282mg, partial [Xenopus laevis]
TGVPADPLPLDHQ